MKISLVIPAYNEQEVIGNTLSVCLDFLSSHFSDFEVIVVDDGSWDLTANIARSFSNVICISYKTNRGKGYAVKRGFLRATGDYIFFTDADLSYSPENILIALSEFQARNASGIVGVRCKKRQSYPPFRRFASACFQGLVHLLLKTDITDTQCGFKAFDKETARTIFSQSEICDFGFDFEIIHIAQLMHKTLVPLPVTFEHRSQSRIHFFLDSAKMLFGLFKVKFKRSIYDANL